MPLKRLLIILYICLIGLLAAATFIEQAYGTEFVERNIYHTIWFCCLWGVIARGCCPHPTFLMAATSRFAVSWLPPRYLGGGHDYIYLWRTRIYAFTSGYSKKQLSFATGRQEHSSAIHDEAR